MNASAKRRRHRACDACNRRKVRCNGQQRCQQCEHLNLRCEYSAPAPRLQGGRNRTKTCLPGKTNQKIAPLYADATNDLWHSGTPQGSMQADGDEAHFFESLLPDFEAYVFPFHPAITILEVRHAIVTMDTDCQARAFVYAFAAVTINLTFSLRGESTSVTTQIEAWLDRAVAAMGVITSSEDMSVLRIATNQFVHVCLMGLGRYDLAFYYLRQSVTMLQIMRVDDFEAMQNFALQERARRQRLYWMVCVHERFFAVSHHRPILLSPLPHLPELDSSLPYSITHGFNQIIRLFMLIDNDLLSKWSPATTTSTSTFQDTSTQPVIELAWIEAKHAQIEAEAAGSSSSHTDDDEDIQDQLAGLSSLQQADLVITKHWLRMLVWQIAISSNCLLLTSSSSSPPSQAHQEKPWLSLLFPVGISTQLRTLLGNMSKAAIEVHGSGVQQKLFELTDTIASVVLTVPAASIEEHRQRIEDFRFLYRFWSGLPRVNTVQREILEGKNQRLRETKI